MSLPTRRRKTTWKIVKKGSVNNRKERKRNKEEQEGRTNARGQGQGTGREDRAREPVGLTRMKHTRSERGQRGRDILRGEEGMGTLGAEDKVEEGGKKKNNLYNKQERTGEMYGVHYVFEELVCRLLQALEFGVAVIFLFSF